MQLWCIRVERSCGRSTQGAVMAEKLYVYEWTPKEGRALLRAVMAYLKKQRDYKRRWRAKRRREGKPT